MSTAELSHRSDGCHRLDDGQVRELAQGHSFGVDNDDSFHQPVLHGRGLPDSCKSPSRVVEHRAIGMATRTGEPPGSRHLGRFAPGRWCSTAPDDKCGDGSETAFKGLSKAVSRDDRRWSTHHRFDQVVPGPCDPGQVHLAYPLDHDRRPVPTHLAARRRRRAQSG